MVFVLIPDVSLMLVVLRCVWLFFRFTARRSNDICFPDISRLFILR